MPRLAWPLGLTVIRVFLGPLMLWLSYQERDPVPWVLLCLYVAVISDIFDGILARRLGVATPALRRFDSQADLVFWLCALGCVWLLQPKIAMRNAGYICLILVLEAATYVISFVKFGREPSTHAYLAKVWGIVLVGTFTAILGFGEDKFSIPILFIAYVVSFVDIVAIILLLPRWQTDVPSAYHAWLIRRNIPIRRHKLFH